MKFAVHFCLLAFAFCLHVAAYINLFFARNTKSFTDVGNCVASRFTTIVPSDVSMVAVYVAVGSIVWAGALE